MISRLLLGSVCAILMASAPRTTHAQTYYSYAFSKQYTVEITRENLKATPDWKENEEHPPLSARKAIVIATKLKDKLVKDSDDFTWKLQHASLTPADDDKWYWLVHFDAEFQGVSTGIPNHLRLVVLMDGTAIEPTVRNQRDK
jgi:hypothetical protein